MRSLAFVLHGMWLLHLCSSQPTADQALNARSDAEALVAMAKAIPKLQNPTGASLLPRMVCLIFRLSLVCHKQINQHQHSWRRRDTLGDKVLEYVYWSVLTTGMVLFHRREMWWRFFKCSISTGNKLRPNVHVSRGYSTSAQPAQRDDKIWRRLQLFAWQYSAKHIEFH